MNKEITGEDIAEESRNMEFFCKDCGEKKKQEWQDRNKGTKIQIGDFVKVGLTDGTQVEHCWLEVAGVSEDGIVSGILDNIPLFVEGFKYGKMVVVKREEIEDHRRKL
jgi:uncharacterized protein YegJ (DUF2314 family)